MSIKIIIADDHNIVVEGLKAVLKQTAPDILVVGEASNGKQALKIAQKVPADIYLLDITMPGLNGLETMVRLLRDNKEAKVLILSMHDDLATVRNAFRSGALGYLVKEGATDNLVKALRTINKGRYYLSPSVSGMSLSDIIRTSSDTKRKPPHALTSKEKEIVQLIAEGMGNKQIADDLMISINTVKVHRHNIALKLNIHKQTDLVRYAIKEKIAKAL